MSREFNRGENGQPPLFTTSGGYDHFEHMRGAATRPVTTQKPTSNTNNGTYAKESAFDNLPEGLGALLSYHPFDWILQFAYDLFWARIFVLRGISAASFAFGTWLFITNTEYVSPASQAPDHVWIYLLIPAILGFLLPSVVAAGIGLITLAVAVLIVGIIILLVQIARFLWMVFLFCLFAGIAIGAIALIAHFG